MKKHMLAVGAHADDVEMSWGGTILKYLDLGYTLTYVLTTNNMSGEFAFLDENGKVRSRSIQPEDEMRVRKEEAARAAEMFGTTPIHLDFPQRHYTGPDGAKIKIDYGSSRPDFLKPGLPSIVTAHEMPDAVKKLTEIILDCDPEVIITRGLADTNIEHICTALYVLKAREAAKKQGYDGALLMCRGVGRGFPDSYYHYDTFIDTTGLMQRKWDAIRCHASQKPLPEKLDLRDFIEGARCGVETVEPFIFGGIGTWRVGPFTTEIFRNHLYCKENYHKMFF
ncbi:MAG: PIG-L family deacetylase [Lentisphaeria bacterium]|nr:PIG-L family deacetylase [Lentisphaeria bacterium]